MEQIHYYTPFRALVGVKIPFLHFDAVFGKARVLLLQEEKPYVIALYVVVYKYQVQKEFLSLDKNKKSFCPWTKRVFSPTKLFLILVLIHTVHTQYYKVRVFYLKQLLQTELNPGITRVKRVLSNCYASNSFSKCKKIWF